MERVHHHPTVEQNGPYGVGQLPGSRSFGEIIGTPMAPRESRVLSIVMPGQHQTLTGGTQSFDAFQHRHAAGIRKPDIQDRHLHGLCRHDPDRLLLGSGFPHHRRREVAFYDRLDGLAKQRTVGDDHRPVRRLQIDVRGKCWKPSEHDPGRRG